MIKITLFILLLTVSFGFAQNTVTIDHTKTWNPYINAFNVSDGNYAFGFSYDLAKNKTTLSNQDSKSVITLQPNYALWTEANNDAAWFNNTGTPPSDPSKTIEVSSYVEDNTLAGSDLTFKANVSGYTIDAGYTVVAFIKALDPANNFATMVNKTQTISATGNFSLSATAAELVAGYTIQYGFSVTGLPADPANETSNGSVVVESVSTASVVDNNFANLSMYPNPASEKLTLRADVTIDNVQLFNVLGKNVMNVSINDNNTSIDVSSLSTGIYILKYSSDNKVGTMKFVKQ